METEPILEPSPEEIEKMVENSEPWSDDEAMGRITEEEQSKNVDRVISEELGLDYMNGQINQSLSRLLRDLNEGT